ncbi:hypothetical protein INP57_25720 [Saccharopolyspora sp. HNM0986]|uniref:hypothetical protein n=1 Tax=Saccharopolyspora galaxeae TaxID=2781241 RepID=UPI00190B3654|nr:hypothetical protein [Saccharopolyspora sp. HNM0986]MBK0870214.1 hypothetical protein [Saccharopolyspora sp. HNM0986]
MQHLRTFRARLERLVLTLALIATTALDHCLSRARRIRVDDHGSESTEKAVLTAIGLTIALGLAGAIAAVVSKYQGQLH